MTTQKEKLAAARRKARAAAKRANKAQQQNASPLATAISDLPDPTSYYDPEGDDVYIGVPQNTDLAQRLENLHRTPFARRVSPGVAGKAFQAYKTGADVETLSQLSSTDPNALLALQLRMNMVGMLDSFQPGSADPATRKAFKDLLAMSNAAMTPWEDMLDQLSSPDAQAIRDQLEGEKNKPPPLTIELANPEDLKSVANTVARTIYGGDLPGAQQESFANAYRQSQADYQTAQYNAQYGGAPASTVEQPMDPKVAAEKQIRDQYPVQVAATSFGKSLDDVLSTFTQNRPGGMT